MRIIDTSAITRDTQLTRNETDWVYNGLDCCVTLEIRDELTRQIDNISGNTYAFSLAMQAPILEMSTRGLRVNLRRRSEVLAKYKKQIRQLSDQLTEIVRDGIGMPVVNDFEKNKLWWRSPTQVKTLLYEVMGLPVQKKRNQNGIMMPSTDRTSLEKLSIYYIAEPVIAHLLILRDIEKKRSWLETEIDPDNRMRTNFNIAGTNTGRLSSSLSDFGTGGNLQNIDRDLRSVFVADEGMKFGNLDLEQADSRNLGALCWENFLEEFGEKFAGGYLDLCESGDLHTQVSRMARPTLPWTDDAKANRFIADQLYYRNYSYRDLDKRLGHGSNYLGMPQTMAKHAKVPVAEVKTFQQNYFSALPCIPQYHKYVRQEIKDRASLTTLFNRRRFFFGRHTDESTIREAVAYSPQSMTAEEINIGLLNLYRANKVQLLVQVHDSVLFQYPEELEDIIVPWALKILRVPLILKRDREFIVPTEAKVGWNWGDKSEENLDGLIKYKGHDDRRRTDLNWKFSIRGM
jgi:DNA polymerase-1